MGCEFVDLELKRIGMWIFEFLELNQGSQLQGEKKLHYTNFFHFLVPG
jgi:hypothetical protein